MIWQFFRAIRLLSLKLPNCQITLPSDWKLELNRLAVVGWLNLRMTNVSEYPNAEGTIINDRRKWYLTTSASRLDGIFHDLWFRPNFKILFKVHTFVKLTELRYASILSLTWAFEEINPHSHYFYLVCPGMFLFPPNCMPILIFCLTKSHRTTDSWLRYKT